MDRAPDSSLRTLNKLSHKISKPSTHQRRQPSPPPPPPPHPDTTTDSPHLPPVYNINKNDFRELVQKLTGSPSHTTPATSPPPPPPPPRPTSRLHRIRPPPLAQISPRPPPLLPFAGPYRPHQQQQPMSPLPPFPACNAAAESPISAYMRFIGCQPPSGLFSPSGLSGFPPLPVSPVPSPGEDTVYDFQLKL